MTGTARAHSSVLGLHDFMFLPVFLANHETAKYHVNHTNDEVGEKEMVEKEKTGWAAMKPVFTAVVLTACLIMVFFGLKEADVKLTDNQIQIKGMYGIKIDFTDVEDITLIEKSMEEIGVGRRTSGFGGMGNTLKGNFESESLGKHLLFVNSGSSPTIFIERAGEADIYISFKDSLKTENLFLDLSKLELN